MQTTVSGASKEQGGTLLSSQPASPQPHPAVRLVEVQRAGGVVQKSQRRVRSHTKPRGYKSQFHRKEATTPLTGEEVGMVLQAARKMTWNRRIAVQVDSSGHYAPGFSEVPDPTFVFRTVQVLLFSAMHISVLPSVSSSDLKTEGGTMHLEWRRPKTARWVSIRVPVSARAWLPEYLSVSKPMTPDGYQHMLERLSQKVEEMFGAKIHLCPLRFRHTGIMGAKNRLNLTDREAATMAASSVQTVQGYASLTDSRLLAQKMEEAGQDKMLDEWMAKAPRPRPTES